MVWISKSAFIFISSYHEPSQTCSGWQLWVCLEVEQLNLPRSGIKRPVVLLWWPNIYSSPQLEACWHAPSLQGGACWPCARPGDESRRASLCRSTPRTTPPHQKRPAAGSPEVSGRTWNEITGDPLSGLMESWCWTRIVHSFSSRSFWIRNV